MTQSDDENGLEHLDVEQQLFELHLKAVGARIRILRHLRGLNQTDVEARTGISRPHLSNMENGQTNLTLKTLFLLARALDVHWAELLDDRDLGQVQQYRRPPTLGRPENQ